MKKTYIAILMAACAVLPMRAAEPETSKLWNQYVQALEKKMEPELPNFSFAGYHHGEQAIPDADWKVFDVTEFGAVPNDKKSDKEAIVKAIAAAETNGSGVVFFPRGKFRINETGDAPNEPIIVRTSKIVFRGSGFGKKDTRLFMDVHMEPTDPEKLYSCPFIFQFEGKGEQDKITTPVTGSARREAHSVVVEDASLFKVGGWVVLKRRDKSVPAILGELAPHRPQRSWTSIVESGLMVDELHQITKIDGNWITFKEPIHSEVTKNGGWSVQGFQPLEEVGVENINFIGNWHDAFKHHRSFFDDSAWSGVRFKNTVNSWIRNCRFTDWSRAAKVSSSAAVSVQHLILDGTRGHNGVTVDRSSHVFAGDVDDRCGHYHSVGVAGPCSGNVFWRCKYTEHTCFESHASQPRVTLFDNITGGFRYGRWGGAVQNLPNHLRYLVLWNYNNIERQRRIEQYQFMRVAEENEHGYIIMPYVIGFHGRPQKFDESQIGVLESNGAPVLPESLYEAQLKLRLGELPEWLVKLKE